MLEIGFNDQNKGGKRCYCGENILLIGVVNNILPLILTGETKTYDEWYQNLYWKLRHFGFQSGQIVDLGQLDYIVLQIMAKRENRPFHRFLGATKDWASAYKGGGSLLSDTNQVWNVEDVLKFADMIRPYNPAWYEEPVHSHDMNAIKE